MIPGAAQLFGSGEALGGLGHAGGAVGWQQGRDGAQLVLHHLPSHPAPPRTEQGWQLLQESWVWEMGTTHRERRWAQSFSAPPVLGCCDGDQMLAQTLPAGI